MSAGISNNHNFADFFLNTKILRRQVNIQICYRHSGKTCQVRQLLSVQRFFFPQALLTQPKAQVCHSASDKTNLLS